jgi:lytic murein transglycosylase
MPASVLLAIAMSALVSGRAPAQTTPAQTVPAKTIEAETVPPETVLAQALLAQSPPAMAAPRPATPPVPANLSPPPPACRNTGDFGRWLETFRAEALAKGILPATVALALDGMTLDESIIRRDRGQSFFAQSFLEFQARLASANRITNARAMLKRQAPLFERVEREFGVPGAVLTAFWALESDFGAGIGRLPVLRSLATLAYDCRRGEMFRGELHAALRIIEKGDLKPSDMVGSWAGELGQTQFLPTHYDRHALDYDGDGRRDLFRSIPDIVASSANYIRASGWQRGEPWLEEVRLPERLPWEQAGLTIRLPRAQWANWGVTRADGEPLPADDLPASLHLLMGRNGPAFLVYPNFDVYTEWNRSWNYATTAAYLATRIAGAPPLSPGRAPVEVLDAAAIREMQQLLMRRGFGDVGIADGRLGIATRAAIRQAQLRYGLPADTYPSMELLERLRQVR